MDLARQGRYRRTELDQFLFIFQQAKRPAGGGPVHAVLGFSGASRL
jgi:hypothetical protein